MRIIGEGYRRVSANSGSHYRARQNSSLRFGSLIVGACVSSFSVFTTTPAFGQVEGRDITPVVIGGQSESQMLQDFLDWALANNTGLYEQYKDTTHFDEVSVEDVLVWREDTEEPVVQITEVSIGEIDIEAGETFTFTIGGLILTSTEGTDFAKTGNSQTDKQLLLESLALKANQSSQLPTNYTIEVIDGKLVITGNEDGSFLVSLSSETNDTEFLVEKKQDFQRVESLLSGSFSVNASCARFLIESRTTQFNLVLSTSISGEVGFYREANSAISINGNVTHYMARVHERQLTSNILLTGGVGTADYESTVFWNIMDLNWDEEDTSTSNQFFATIFEKNVNIDLAISTQAIKQVTSVRHTSSEISLSSNVGGQSNAIFTKSASSSISLNTNTNYNIILGWSNDTTTLENLTQNWETS